MSCEVRLEIARAGRPHNQLLSPYTPYVALCEGYEMATIYLDFEQQELEQQLRGLGYDRPLEDRNAQLRILGGRMRDLLSRIPALSGALAEAGGPGGELVHLRLVASPAEWARVPLELALSTDGMAGSDDPLLLQSGQRISLTREVRGVPRGAPLPEREPRILFAYAQPFGASVPAQDHLTALRRAVAPWLPPDSEANEHQAFRQMITILGNASLEDIRKACKARHFTHVHILAHSFPTDSPTTQRYGVVLHEQSGDVNGVVVDGERLAAALVHPHGGRLAAPFLVTLATCQGGDPGSVVVPGGGTAYALHVAGVPVVIASQFALTIDGSSMLTEDLYGRILWGEDPREAVSEVRRHLFASLPKTHDWASLVTYVNLPRDFHTHVLQQRHTRAVESIRAVDRGMRKIEFAGADASLKVRRETALARLAEATRRLEELLVPLKAVIQQQLGQLRNEAPVRALAAVESECVGWLAAGAKRRAQQLFELGRPYESCLRESFHLYRRAMDADRANFWVITQYLGLHYVLDHATDTSLHRYATAQATVSVEDNGKNSAASWACGSLAELALINAEREPATIRDEVLGHIAKLLELLPAGDPDGVIESSRRQFARFERWWNVPTATKLLAGEAAEMLAQGARQFEASAPMADAKEPEGPAPATKERRPKPRGHKRTR